MTAYRAAGPPRPAVTLVLRAPRQIYATIFMALVMVLPLLLVRVVTVDCARAGPGAGTCRVSERGLFTWRTREIALPALTAIRVDTQDSDGTTLSRLVLVTTSGEQPVGLGHDNLDLAGRRRLAEGFAEFKRGQAERVSLSAGLGALWAIAVWVAFCGPVLLATFMPAMRAVIDPPRGVVRVRRWLRAVELPLSRELRITSETDDDGDTSTFLEAPGQRLKLPASPRMEDVVAFEAAIWDATKGASDP